MTKTSGSNLGSFSLFYAQLIGYNPEMFSCFTDNGYE